MADPVRAYPSMPNSDPGVRREMLETIGAPSIDALFASVPEPLRLRRPLGLPPAMADEHSLRRHLEDLLRRNRHTGEVLSFLGGGCAGHVVPAAVDEIVGRAEFVTAYGGGPYADQGKYQAIFEFQSLIGELTGMDVVSAPTYDGVTATSSALLMAARLTGRSRLLVPATADPMSIAHLRTIALPWATVQTVGVESGSGLLDLVELRSCLGPDVAAVLVENPSYLGFVEYRADEVAALAHDAGAMLVVRVDPATLGLLAAPADYGADIVAGDVQSLGMHQLFGGGQCGFLAHRDDETFVRENPGILISAVPTRDGTATGFAWTLLSSTSYDLRGDSRDFTGTSTWLWGIGAAVHLSLLGPSGITELGEGLAARAAYAIERLSAVPGLAVPAIGHHHVKEFVVGFEGTGVRVADVNAALLERGVFGGHDLSDELPWLGQAALYCVTERHTQADIDRLAEVLEEVVA